MCSFLTFRYYKCCHNESKLQLSFADWTWTCTSSIHSTSCDAKSSSSTSTSSKSHTKCSGTTNTTWHCRYWRFLCTKCHIAINNGWKFAERQQRKVTILPNLEWIFQYLRIWMHLIDPNRTFSERHQTKLQLPVMAKRKIAKAKRFDSILMLENVDVCTI